MTIPQIQQLLPIFQFLRFEWGGGGKRLELGTKVGIAQHFFFVEFT